MSVVTEKTALQKLKDLRACSDAISWVDSKSPETAWKTCDRGDWMLWLVGKLSGRPQSEERKKLVLCACECARLALPYAKSPRVLKCIETSERWARGEASIEELWENRKQAYAAAASDAAAAAAAYAAADAAAYAAAYAAASAYAAAYAAYAAASDAAAAAADAAAYAAASDAAADARSKTLSQCADIVRRHYPECPLLSK